MPSFATRVFPFSTRLLAGLLVVASLVGVLRAQEDDKTLRVFVFAGQSNMVGSDSRVEDIGLFPPFAGLDQPQKDVKFSYCIGREEKLESDGWVELQPVDGVVGPELSFARRVRENIRAPIAIIKVAAGGTHLGGDWNPDEPSGFKLYPLALDWIRAARNRSDSPRMGPGLVRREHPAVRPRGGRSWLHGHHRRPADLPRSAGVGLRPSQAGHPGQRPEPRRASPPSPSSRLAPEALGPGSAMGQASLHREAPKKPHFYPLRHEGVPEQRQAWVARMFCLSIRDARTATLEGHDSRVPETPHRGAEFPTPVLTADR